MDLTTTVCLFLTWTVSAVHTQSCTRRVLVENKHVVHMVTKIPAKCSNWDKAWVWMTGKDCGTKYKMEPVNYPSGISQLKYITKKVCCPNENCYDGSDNNGGLDQNNQKFLGDSRKDSNGGLDENDQKFLAITFGSATAALVIILLIIVLSFCRKQQPRFIENFFNRRQRMYEEDIIGVQPSAPFFEGSDYHYKNGGAARLIESEYEEIPEYNAKDKYPVLGACSNGYNQETCHTERRVSNQNDYTGDLLISLSSENTGIGNHEGEVTPSSEARSGPYENATVEMVPVQETNTRVFESLSRADDSSLPPACRNDASIASVSQNISEFNSRSPSKCSNGSLPNDYIDFSNIVVPRYESNNAVSQPSLCDHGIVTPSASDHSEFTPMLCEQGIAPPKAHSYEKLDMATRNNNEELYDALHGSVNEEHKEPKSDS